MPSYTVAFLTEKVTLVVPTLAMFLLIANSIESGSVSNRNRIEEDGSSMDDSIQNGSLGETMAEYSSKDNDERSFFKSL